MNQRRDAWRSILDARNDVDRMVAASMGDYPDNVPVRPSQGGTQPGGGVPFQDATWSAELGPASDTAEDSAAIVASEGDAAREISEDELRVLRELHYRVCERLEQLAGALSREPGRDDAMKALSIAFDERILEQLPDFACPSWPLLQTARTGSITGGEDFYRTIDFLRSTPDVPSIVFEVYYFCLANGFVGRYANALDKVEEYKDRLRDSISAPRSPRDKADTMEILPDTTKPHSAWVTYGISLLVVVLFTVLTTALSNF